MTRAKSSQGPIPVGSLENRHWACPVRSARPPSPAISRRYPTVAGGNLDIKGINMLDQVVGTCHLARYNSGACGRHGLHLSRRSHSSPSHGRRLHRHERDGHQQPWRHHWGSISRGTHFTCRAVSSSTAKHLPIYRSASTPAAGWREVIHAFGINNVWPDRGHGSGRHQQWKRRRFSRDADYRLRRPIVNSRQWVSLNTVPVPPNGGTQDRKYPVGAVRDFGGRVKMPRRSPLRPVNPIGVFLSSNAQS